MTKTAHYNDPILTADDINLEAFRETMQRFQSEASKPRGERNTEIIDDLLDRRLRTTPSAHDADRLQHLRADHRGLGVRPGLYPPEFGVLRPLSRPKTLSPVPTPQPPKSKPLQSPTATKMVRGALWFLRWPPANMTRSPRVYPQTLYMYIISIIVM